MSEQGILICNAVLDSPEPSIGLPYASKETCAGCGCQVWVSNASRKLIQEQKLAVMCTRCAKQKIKDSDEKPEFQLPTEEQIAEMIESLQNH